MIAGFGIGLIAVLGLAIGSFLNVVIHRVPAGRSVVSPPSACPGCGSEIAWYDNVPVLSWLLLRGRCRTCSMRIPARYPLVELAGAGFFALVAAFLLPPVIEATDTLTLVGHLLVLVLHLFLAAVSLALAIIDLETHRLPNALTYPAYPVAIVLLGIASLLIGEPVLLLQAAIGGAALFVFYLVLALVYPGGMGLGDVKLAGVLGFVLAWHGWGVFAVGVFAPFLLGGLFSIILLVSRRVGRKSGIPFGPWMLLGAWVGIFVGEEVSAWYLGLFGLV